jgi:hypothetical protein
VITYPKPNNNRIENIKKNLGYILIEKGLKKRGKHCTVSITTRIQKVELIKQWNGDYHRLGRRKAGQSVQCFRLIPLINSRVILCSMVTVVNFVTKKMITMRNERYIDWIVLIISQ